MEYPDMDKAEVASTGVRMDLDKKIQERWPRMRQREREEWTAFIQELYQITPQEEAVILDFVDMRNGAGLLQWLRARG